MNHTFYIHVVIELDSTVTPVRVCQLPSGVKCLVEDEHFIYAGCTNGALYGEQLLFIQKKNYIKNHLELHIILSLLV